MPERLSLCHPSRRLVSVRLGTPLAILLFLSDIPAMSEMVCKNGGLQNQSGQEWMERSGFSIKRPFTVEV